MKWEGLKINKGSWKGWVRQIDVTDTRFKAWEFEGDGFPLKWYEKKGKLP